MAARTLGATALLAATMAAQVDYEPDGRPWSHRVSAGPDAAVPGWFYNLGATGLRVRLLAESPTWLGVAYVFPGSPAAAAGIAADDVLVGAGGARFATPHQDGYGPPVFGPRGPILDFAVALEAAETTAPHELALTVRRGAAERDVRLTIPPLPPFAAGWPADDARSTQLSAELRGYLLAHQRDDGSWGNPVSDTFAPLALLALGDEQAMAAVTRCAHFHAATTKAQDLDSLINWRYCAAGIVLGEYYLTTHERWVLPELQEVVTFLCGSQYLDPAQMSPRAKVTHPDAQPKRPGDKIGGWGHNPGFEGYGPICMLTGQGAIAIALAQRCGSEFPRRHLDAAYDFLARGTGRNGYVWYEDSVASDDGWADPGRTGAAGVANALFPYEPGDHAGRAVAHARAIGEHPLSFPDTHGSPPMGMAWAAAAAARDPASLRALLDQNRWWFVLARCADGSFYYQPNRDNAGYEADSRVTMSAVVAFVLTLPKRALLVTGRTP